MNNYQPGDYVCQHDAPSNIGIVKEVLETNMKMQFQLGNDVRFVGPERCVPGDSSL